jgi:hypothetical protein
VCVSSTIGMSTKWLPGPIRVPYAPPVTSTPSLLPPVKTELAIRTPFGARFSWPSTVMRPAWQASQMSMSSCRLPSNRIRWSPSRVVSISTGPVKRFPANVTSWESITAADVTSSPSTRRFPAPSSSKPMLAAAPGAGASVTGASFSTPARIP